MHNKFKIALLGIIPLFLGLGLYIDNFSSNNVKVENIASLDQVGGLHTAKISNVPRVTTKIKKSYTAKVWPKLVEQEEEIVTKDNNLIVVSTLFSSPSYYYTISDIDIPNMDFLNFYNENISIAPAVVQSAFATIDSNIFPAATSISGFSPTTIVSGIPEPATWLLLISGFGIVGCSLRNNRTQIKVLT